MSGRFKTPRKMPSTPSHPDNPHPKVINPKGKEERAAYMKWYNAERRLRGTRTLTGMGDGRSAKVKVLSDL